MGRPRRAADRGGIDGTVSLSESERELLVNSHGVEHYGHSIRDSGSHKYLAPSLLDLCRRHNAKSVLDLGCGNGALCRLLHEQGMKVVGAEPSRDGYAVASKLDPEIRIYPLSLSDSPAAIEESNFDIVISAEVVEHLYDPELLPRFAAEKLRSDGLLIVTTPYHGYAKNLLIAASGKWDGHHQPLRTGGHIKFWSRRTLGRLLERNGFRVESFVGVGRVPLLWKSMILVARRMG